jgi:hypothetical protein
MEITLEHHLTHIDLYRIVDDFGNVDTALGSGRQWLIGYFYYGYMSHGRYLGFEFGSCIIQIPPHEGSDDGNEKFYPIH